MQSEKHKLLSNWKHCTWVFYSSKWSKCMQILPLLPVYAVRPITCCSQGCWCLQWLGRQVCRGGWWWGSCFKAWASFALYRPCCEIDILWKQSGCKHRKELWIRGGLVLLQANYEPEADEPAAKKSKVSEWAAKSVERHDRWHNEDDSHPHTSPWPFWCNVKSTFKLFCRVFVQMWTFWTKYRSGFLGLMGWGLAGETWTWNFKTKWFEAVPIADQFEIYQTPHKLGMLCAVPTENCLESDQNMPIRLIRPRVYLDEQRIGSHWKFVFCPKLLWLKTIACLLHCSQ